MAYDLIFRCFYNKNTLTMLLQKTIFWGYGIVPYKIYCTYEIVNLCLVLAEGGAIPYALIIFELPDFQETDDYLSYSVFRLQYQLYFLVSASISSYTD